MRSPGRLLLTLLLLRLQLTEKPLWYQQAGLLLRHAVAITNECMVSVVMGPILPQEAEKRGVGPRAVGMIFSIYAFVNFCVSPYMGKALQRGSVLEPHLAYRHSSAQPLILRSLDIRMPACMLPPLLPSIFTHMKCLSYVWEAPPFVDVLEFL